MQKSPIEWTDFTANPIRYRDPDGNVVHACIHKSGGCLHCYAEVLAGRWGRAGKKFTAENMKRLTPFLDDKELHQMLTHKPASGKRCFVGDMTDIFGEWVPFELLDKLFAVFALRPDVTFQVLTKRPERMREYVGALDTKERIEAASFSLPTAARILNWPLPNVWLGVSVEDQKTADERIPLLLQTPAAVRFVSYEPALGPVDFRKWLGVALEIGEHFDGEFPLDPQVREHGIEEENAIAGTRNLPSTERLPAVTRPGLDGLSAMLASDDLDQPFNDGDECVVDGNSRAIRSSGASSPVQVPFAVEKPRDIGEDHGVIRNSDSRSQQPRADASKIYAASNQAPPNAGPRDSGTNRNVRNGETGGVKSNHCAIAHAPHYTTRIDWLIAGGESGPGARHFDISWADSVIRQCRDAGVACFVKQLGANPVSQYPGEPIDPGSYYALKLKNRKGGSMEEWPQDLRVREFPKEATR